MQRNRARFPAGWLGLPFIAFGFAQPARADLSASMPPGGNFDLGHWVLTVPADADGGTDGPAISITPAQLSGPNGYSSPWFHTDAAGAMTFWAPVTGTTVGGSSHPRSELREVLDPADGSVNWSDAGRSALWAQCKVTRVPGNGRVVIGQVHSYGSNPLILLEYDYDAAARTGQLTAIMETFPGADPHDGSAHLRYAIATGVALGQAITYEIHVDDVDGRGVVSAFANGGAAASMVMDPRWDAETFYFKAGAYTQDDEGTPDEGGKVRFFRLVASHPDRQLAVRTGSALPHATAGANYRQALSATGGAGPLVWSLASGLLPAGLRLDPSGTISGKPAVDAGSAAVHTFSALAADAEGGSVAKTFSLVVDPAASPGAAEAEPERD